MSLSVVYDNCTIDIEGNSESLREFARQISQCSGTCQVLLTGSCKKAGATNARSITVSVKGGPVIISLLQEAVTISGSREKLGILAQNLLWLADESDGTTAGGVSDHIHIEYHPGHFYLAEGSIPVVVTKSEIET